MPARRLAGQLRRARCANARIILQHGQIRNGIRFYSIPSGELTIRLVFIRAFTLVPILVLLVSYLVCHMVFQAHSTSRLIGKYLYASKPNMSGTDGCVADDYISVPYVRSHAAGCSGSD